VAVGGVIVLLVAQMAFQKARASSSKPTPIEKSDLPGVWEGLQVGPDGEVYMARLSVKDEVATLVFCVFDGSHVDPICEEFDLSHSLDSRGGRVRAEGQAKSKTDVWRKVRLAARGSAAPGFGRMDATITFYDGRGGRIAVWQIGLYRTEESLLDDIGRELTRFKTRFPR